MERGVAGPGARSNVPRPQITSLSPLSPGAFSCCQCHGETHDIVIIGQYVLNSCLDGHDPRPCAGTHGGRGCQIWDNMGQPVLLGKVPTVFSCSCNEEHTAFEVMTQETITCSCGAPGLQAVYDQFGSILLWPGGDHGMDNLRDPKKVAEARRQFLAVGGAVWLEKQEEVLEYFKAEVSPNFLGPARFLHAVEESKRVTERPKEVRRELVVETKASPSPSLSASFSTSPSPSPSDDIKGLEPTEMMLCGADVGLFSAKEAKEIHLVNHTRGWSEVSVETEDSFDAELASWDMMNYPR